MKAPIITPGIIEALNETAAFLALDDFGPKGLDGRFEGRLTVPRPSLA
jgi:hypothetical protein